MTGRQRGIMGETPLHLAVPASILIEFALGLLGLRTLVVILKSLRARSL